MTARTRFCDGVARRDFLQVGAAGLFGIGLSLSEMLAAQSRAAASGNPAADRSLIVVFLKGGLSTIDTFDMKPNAPAEIRGEFQPAATRVPGVQICDLLPRTAQCIDRFSLIRSFTHPDSNHGPADHIMLTGYAPGPGFNGGLSPNNHYPSFGSVIARKLGPRGAVPPYVCVPDMHPSGGAAYLGPAAVPFVINADPSAPNFSVPDLVPPMRLDAARLSQRRELLRQVDRFQQAAETAVNRSARTVSVFRQKAFDLMTSADAKAAFDLEQEPAALRDQYGRHTLGQSCLLARRLVEAGVRCVTIDHANWDTHDNNFRVLRDQLLPHLDSALSSLFTDLDQRGLLQQTLVVVTGEFGRTPRINNNAGRDHWGPCFTVALGGGGIQGGRVVGTSDAWAQSPAENPYGPGDLAATMYHLLGIDPAEEFHTPEGRPVALARGKLIRELL